jgi:hypothetical protein
VIFRYLTLGVLIVSLSNFAQADSGNIDYRSTNEFSPNDYLFGSHGNLKDPVFDVYRTIDLSVDIGIGSDCGRIDFKNTLKSAFTNVLDEKYLEGMGKDILAASPMLLISYFSPTWAAIIKHTRIRANFLAQLRLNQCKAINKFVDNRVSDYYEERSSCIQKSMKRHNNDFEKAMEGCKNYADYNISKWAGDGKSGENKLIESAAKWAGFKGESADRIVGLTKAFIGDTVIKKGSVSVDFGPRRVQLTPRTYLMEVKNKTYSRLCKGLLGKFVRSGGYKANIYRTVSDDDLKAVSGTDKTLIDRQTILSLAYLPYKKRRVACRKLSDAIAMNKYSDDMGKTLDFISSKMGANPHYPTKRKAEIDRKRRSFKDQTELTLAFEKNNTDPLNKVLYQINSEGAKYMGAASEREMQSDSDIHQSERVENIFFDCADDIGCSE